MYISTRPGPEILPMKAPFFRWQGVDGSTVYVYRSPTGSYTHNFGQVGAMIERMIERCADQPFDQLLLWGVGDHGGGATRVDMKVLDEWMARDDLPYELRHSTPEAFLAAMKTQNPDPPIHEGDMQKIFTGCYTSEAATKRKHRRLDSLVHKAERYAAMAKLLVNAEPPQRQIDAAWRGHMFNTFHDILPGSSTEPGIDSSATIFGHAEAEAADAILASQIALVRDEAAGCGIPLFVFNPHPYPVETPIVSEFMLGWHPMNPDPNAPRINVKLETLEGEPVPVQTEKSHSNVPLDWRRRISFTAKVPPLGIKRYRIVKEPDKPIENNFVDVIHESDESIELNNGFFELSIDKKTGQIARLFDIRIQKEVVSGPAFVPLVINDPGCAWGFGVDAYRDVAGDFRFVDNEETGYLANGVAGRRDSISIIERGPIRTVAETILRWGRSSIRMRYVLWHTVPHFDLDMRVNWDERRRMLKLSIPLASSIARADAGIPFGSIGRPLDGGEHHCNRWVALSLEAGNALAILNSAQHGFDATKEEFRQTLLRSPVVNHHGHAEVSGLPEDRAFPFLDLGQHDITLRMLSGPESDILSRVGHESELMHCPLDSFATFPTGRKEEAERGEIEGPFRISDKRIALTAFKRSEDGRAWVVRLHNTTGQEVECELMFAGLDAVKASFGPHQARTWRIEDSGLQPCSFEEK